MSFTKYCRVFWGVILINLLTLLAFLACIFYVENCGYNFLLICLICLISFLAINSLIFILLAKLVENKKKNKKILSKCNKEVEECFLKVSKTHNLIEAGQISLGVYHDLSNILTSSNLALHRMMEKFKNIKELDKFIIKIFKINYRANLLIKSFKSQCQSDKYRIKFNLLNEIKKNLLILEYSFIKNNIKKEIMIEKDINIFGDPIKFGQVVLNLINNAIESFDNAQKNRKILISAREIKNKKCGCRQIELIVEDSGKGIPGNILKSIFEPFFSSKNNIGSNHCGVGLAIIKRIIETDFSGNISVISLVNQGTKFKIVLPDFKV